MTMDTTMSGKCERMTCQNQIGKIRPFYRIKNCVGFGHGHKDYCVSCGRMIIEYNDHLEYKVIYEWEFDEFKQFLERKIKTRDNETRVGQVVMTTLNQIWPNQYKRIMNGCYDEEDLDCFYDDSIIPKTMAHLEEEWVNKDD